MESNEGIFQPTDFAEIMKNYI
ncbi:hypothetical protein EAPG_01451 [Escherichia albertii B156]|nr:hypothetical protein EAPG_01451 [Escherichia albertii B156]